jgi:hypothetical protein
VAPAYWTPAKIVQALQRDAARRGRPPTRLEWAKAPTRRLPGYSSRRRPTSETVAAVMGSWSAAMAAAGLEPRSPGGQPREHCRRGHEIVGGNLIVRPDGKRTCRTRRREGQRARRAARGAQLRAAR